MQKVQSVSLGLNQTAKGFTLIEVLISLALTASFMCALIPAAICLEKNITAWDRSLRRQQSLAAALFFMSKDLRMAGSNPIDAVEFPELELIPEKEGRSVEIEMVVDKRGAKIQSRPDGDCNDPDENISFFLDKSRQILRRNGQPMALRILEKAEEQPLFLLETSGSEGLIHLFLSIGKDETAFSLSTAVYLRNSF